ncbi:MAG: hypothetical protein C4B58_10925 [Deltaproteobacteria bacterium]|nr:MAG: hypothetical protein C4B58_10925 [Deltaproteobacteria bacterium]
MGKRFVVKRKIFDLCGYTSDCATHEKEKNYHENTKGKPLDGHPSAFTFGFHSMLDVRLFFVSFFVSSYLRVFVMGFE